MRAPADAITGPSRVEAEEARVRTAYARRVDGHRYSWFDPAHLAAVQERERHVLSLLKAHGFRSLAGCRILELGCGTGFWLREFMKWGARPENVTGVELLTERADQAERLCPRGVRIVRGSAATFETHGAWDVVLQSMLFTSVLDVEVRRAIAARMLDAVRPGGLILWYDYYVDNPRNLDVRGVRRAEIARLFPGCRISIRRVTLAAPIARVLMPGAPWVCRVLATMPWLRTHYLAAIQPPDPDPGGASQERGR